MDDLREAKPVSVYVREWTYEQKRGRLTETQASNASLMAMRREGDEIERPLLTRGIAMKRFLSLTGMN